MPRRKDVREDNGQQLQRVQAAAQPLNVHVVLVHRVGPQLDMDNLKAMYDKLNEALKFLALAKEFQLEILESKDAITIIQRDMASCASIILN